jgi:uncharacterized protein YuzE
MVRFRYDPTVDALAVELSAGKSAKTVRVTPTVALDFDKKGRLLGVEVLDASFHVDRAALAQLPGAAEQYTLLEAERESGIKASTLRVQLNAGRIKGVKRGRDWYVDATDLLNYMESRSPRGRPAENNSRARKSAIRKRA